MPIGSRAIAKDRHVAYAVERSTGGFERTRDDAVDVRLGAGTA
jgi:hypothetical protein